MDIEKRLADLVLSVIGFYCLLDMPSVATAQESPVPPAPSTLEAPSAPPVIPPKEAIPSDADCKSFESTLKSLFAQEYTSRDPKMKISLAEKLCEIGRSASSPAEKYVIMKEAQKAYWEGGDYLQGLTVLENMTNAYTIEPKIVIDAFSAVKSKVRKPDEAARLCDYALLFGDHVAKSRQFDDAERIPGHAKDLAITAKDRGLLERTGELAGMIPEMKRLCADAEKAEAAYNANPNDARTNETLGKYHCFMLGDWDKGIAYLAKSECPIKAALNDEKRRPEEPKAMMGLGDQWANLAKQTSSKLEKNGLSDRARFWYEKALPISSGIVKIALEKKLVELGPKSGVEMSLIDLKPSSTKVGWGRFIADKVNVQTIPDSGETFPEINKKKPLTYIFAHAPSEAVYPLPAHSKQCKGFAWRSDTGGRGNGVRFIIKIDKQVAFKSDLIQKGNVVIPFDVRIPYGSKEMVFIVDDNGDIAYDSACWLDVVLIK
jgi:hypothetical protein